jgi:polysaccharide export outer membrane protein
MLIDRRILVCLFVTVVMATAGAGSYRPQDRPKEEPAAKKPADTPAKSDQQDEVVFPDFVIEEKPVAPMTLPPDEEAKLPKIADIKPLPEVPISDDPPPHEGAMIDIPYIVEPPDLLQIEVFVPSNVPFRAITGDRLVRPDGTITLGWYGDLHVRGLTVDQIKVVMIMKLRRDMSDHALGLVGEDQDGNAILVPPSNSDRVFVDVAAYNSKVYYVQGDVNAPGRLPVTGHDTVLDALNYAGGLSSYANPKDIVLYRPARGGKPTKSYTIDLDAINKGDARSNLQLFANDRIVVGRTPIVTQTVNLDRVAAPINTLETSILNHLYATKSLADAMDRANLSPEQRRRLLDAWLDLYVEASKRSDGEAPDPDQLCERMRALTAPLLEPRDREATTK